MASNTHKYVAKEGSRNFFCRRAPHGARGLKLLSLGAELRKYRRAPHGARGLKQAYWCYVSVACLSRPARGAWIETRRRQGRSLNRGSRPARGAWIETSPSLGLAAALVVAPRTGRVD